jgi:high affinity Mn2+ porin
MLFQPRIGKTISILFIFLAFTGNVFAQGNDEDNNYKGLLSNSINPLDKWICHFQFTNIVQAHPSFHAPYSGKNSLKDSAESTLSVTATFYLGRKLWKGATIYVNPEIAGGKGISYALGLAGAANGETFRVGSPAPALYVGRAYFEQHIAVGKSKEPHKGATPNELKNDIPTSRITITVGKFSLEDFFDDNAYAHDPRSEFLNWSLMANGAWDYPANTRGYTWGGVIEYVKPGYVVRFAAAMVPKLANSQVFDLNIAKGNSEIFEFEKKWLAGIRPGSLRVLVYANHSVAPAYGAALQGMTQGDSTLVSVISGQKEINGPYGLKYGFGMSFNQELTQSTGIFARVGWNDGKTATWAFTEIDRTASIGLRFKANIIHRPHDNVGIAFVANGISDAHLRYLNANGYGFMLGDDKLPHYGLESILEVFYKVKLIDWLWVTADYQFIANPAYNKDRGPVHVFSLRSHVEF